MTERSRKYLSDIVMAIALVEEFILDVTDFTNYNSDKKTQSAVERQLVIIGEALNNFRRLEPEIQIEHDRQIIAFRNRLVHAYDNLDNAIVWAIIKNHLRLLKEEIEKLPD